MNQMPTMLTDINTEENILSLIFKGNNQERADIFGKLEVNDFFFDGNKQLYMLLYSMQFNGEEISPLSIVQLHEGDVKKMPLKSSIIQIATGVYEGGNVVADMEDNSDKPADILIKRLKQKRQMRELQDIAVRIKHGIEQEENPEKIYEAINKMVLARTEMGGKRSFLTPMNMGQLVMEEVAKMMDTEKKDKDVIFTSYNRLNYISGGFEKGNLIILSAASGVGKSAFAMNIIRDVAYVGNKSVLYINSEMTQAQIARRYASLFSGVSHRKIRSGVSAEEHNRIGQKMEVLIHKQIFTSTIPDLQLANVVSEIRRIVDQFGVELVVVDYIGRMDISQHGRELQEWQIMEQTARELKNTALALGIVVIMVAQLSSNGVSLAKGSNMKNECDLWLNLKRVDKDDLKAYYDMHGEGLEKHWNMMVEFRKARSSEYGASLPMHFHGDTLTFTDDEEQAKKYLSMENSEGVSI